jgi:hypothetical protein
MYNKTFYGCTHTHTHTQTHTNTHTHTHTHTNTHTFIYAAVKSFIVQGKVMIFSKLFINFFRCFMGGARYQSGD